MTFAPTIVLNTVSRRIYRFFLEFLSFLIKKNSSNWSKIRMTFCLFSLLLSWSIIFAIDSSSEFSGVSPKASRIVTIQSPYCLITIGKQDIPSIEVYISTEVSTFNRQLSTPSPRERSPESLHPQSNEHWLIMRGYRCFLLYKWRYEEMFPTRFLPTTVKK